MPEQYYTSRIIASLDTPKKEDNFELIGEIMKKQMKTALFCVIDKCVIFVSFWIFLLQAMG